MEFGCLTAVWLRYYEIVSSWFRSLSFSKQFVFGNVRMQSVRFNFRLLYDSCVIDVALCRPRRQLPLCISMPIDCPSGDTCASQAASVWPIDSVHFTIPHIHIIVFFSFSLFLSSLSPVHNCLACLFFYRMFLLKFRTTRTLAHKNAHFVQLKSHDFSFLSPASLYLCLAGIVDACSVHTKHLYVFNSQRFLRYFRFSQIILFSFCNSIECERRRPEEEKIQNTNEFNAINSIAHDFLYAHDNKIGIW